MACAPSKDSDQPVHLPSLIRVFAVRMKEAWVLSYLLSAQRRFWSDWADAQADLSLCWVHMPFRLFCHEVAQDDVIKLRTPTVIAVIILKFEEWGFTTWEWVQKVLSIPAIRIIAVSLENLHMSLVTRKPAFSVFDQVILKQVCSATETS